MLKYNAKTDELSVKTIRAEFLIGSIADIDINIDSDWIISVINDNGFALTNEQSDKISTLFNVIASFSAIESTTLTSFEGSGKLIIEGKEGNERHITELLITNNGTTSIATEYGTIFTSGTKMFDVEVVNNGTFTDVNVVPFNSNTKQYKITGSKL